MLVAVVGSRDTGSYTVEQMLSHIPQNTSQLISGGAEGIDRMAERAAGLLNLPMKVFHPDYQLFGRTAPLVRNRKIVEYSDFVVAFWDGKSKGTANTLGHCIELHKPFRIILLPHGSGQSSTGPSPDSPNFP